MAVGAGFFRSKIKGVYFSIMTQALTYAGMLLFFRNETGFGGNNGCFISNALFSVTATTTRIALFLATVMLLILALGTGYALAKSKVGRILTAVRDAENRLTFCGYDPADSNCWCGRSPPPVAWRGRCMFHRWALSTQEKCHPPTR
jgi:ABC-type branched-subunit amino acid transport system permease subunit